METERTSSRRQWILLFTIISVNLNIIMEALADAVPLNVIQGYLAIDDVRTDWINNTFLIFLGMCVPPAIYLSRRYGFRKLFLIGTIFFISGSFLTGLSTTYYELLAYRALAGIGSGLVFPISLTIIKRTFVNSHEGLAISLYIGVSFGLGFTLGPIIGGIFGQVFMWRSMYFFIALLNIPCLFLILRFMEETKRYPTDRFDALSFIYFVLFLISTLTVLTQAKAPWNTLGWRSGFTISCLFILVGSLTLLIFHYQRITSPLFALSLFKSSRFSIICICMGCVGIMLFGADVIFISLLENVFHYERIRTGMAVSVIGIVFLLTGAFVSSLSKKVPLEFFALFGVFLLATGCFLNHSLTFKSELKDILWLFVMRAAGVGFSLGPLTAMALKGIPDDLAGQGASIVTICRQVGAAFGSSAIALIATSRNAFHLLRFGEQVDVYSAKYRYYMQSFRLFLGKGGAQSAKEISDEAKQYVIENIRAQSELLSYNDAFFIFGCVFSVLFFVIGILIFFPGKKTSASA